MKAVLSKIAAEVDDKYHFNKSQIDFELDFLIEEKTCGRGGILIIDEAQHLVDAKLEHGIRISTDCVATSIKGYLASPC